MLQGRLGICVSDGICAAGEVGNFSPNKACPCRGSDDVGKRPRYPVSFPAKLRNRFVSVFTAFEACQLQTASKTNRKTGPKRFPMWVSYQNDEKHMVSEGLAMMTCREVSKTNVKTGPKSCLLYTSPSPRDS